MMPTLLKRKEQLLRRGGNIGEVHKHHSDMIMEATWDRDPQSKRCYIYDYYHDDNKELCGGYDPSESLTKTPIDAKFIVTQYQTISKDAVEYHIQFKPSQKLHFEDKDELYYYETDYRQRYGATFPIGLYIDIPNEHKVYEKWLICNKEDENCFPKYSVLKCTYNYMWISEEGGRRVKNKMWAVGRNQNSYNSGLIKWFTINLFNCWNPSKLYKLQRKYETELSVNVLKL